MSERYDGLTDEERADGEELAGGEELLDEDDEDEVDQDEVDREPIEETHPGFTISCDECGSELVVVENDLEFSPAVGRQGNVYLRCTECDAETFLLPPAGEEPDGDDEADLG